MKKSRFTEEQIIGFIRSDVPEAQDQRLGARHRVVCRNTALL